MNTDFRLAVGLFQHPKFIKLRRRLGSDAGLGYICLLSFTAQNHPDGSLGDMDEEDIAIASQYEGDAAAFVAALVDLRLLDKVGDAYLVHDWVEHNPWAAAAPERSEKARRAAYARWGMNGAYPEESSEDTTGTDTACDSIPTQYSEHATSMQVASSGNAPSVPSVPSVPSQTIQASGDARNVPQVAPGDTYEGYIARMMARFPPAAAAHVEERTKDARRKVPFQVLIWQDIESGKIPESVWRNGTGPPATPPPKVESPPTQPSAEESARTALALKKLNELSDRRRRRANA